MVPSLFEQLKVLLYFVSGNQTFENVLTMILGNPILSGTVIAFFLDNTVPGKWIVAADSIVCWNLIPNLLKQTVVCLLL